MKKNDLITFVVMPAYNAAQTLVETYEAIPAEFKKNILLVDDCSSDETVAIAKKLGLMWVCHHQNRGYGANQKTCYRIALEKNADVVVMLHPDYQYDPALIPEMVSLVKEGKADVVLGSRFLDSDPRRYGMPLYKYYANRFLTGVQNHLMGMSLSEYHTGYRVFHKKVLQNICFESFSDDFIFDNQLLSEIIVRGYQIHEIKCSARYFEAASSISCLRSLFYGIGVLRNCFSYKLRSILRKGESEDYRK